MSNRKDFYFKQPVTESELDDAFTDLENADHEIITDQGLYGIFQGGACAQHSPVANLTVDVSGPMYGYDTNGQRILTPGPSINVNVAQDSSSISTNVAGGGNEKWVSIAVKFARVLTDPRVDGNSITVYFDRAESYTVIVTQGAEAAAGTAVRPTLDPDALLLCDVKRTFGQTQVINANIDTARRQDTYMFAAPPGGVGIRAGTPKDAILAMLTDLNNHILGLAGAHDGTAITFTSTGVWANAATIAAVDVSGAINEIVSDLANIGLNTAGAYKIGYHKPSGFFTATNLNDAITELISDIQATAAPDGAGLTGLDSTGFVWADASSLGQSNVHNAIGAILSQLTATAGSARVGAPAVAVSFSGAPWSLSSGAIAGHISSLLGDVNAPYRIRTFSSSVALDNSSIRDSHVLLDASGAAFNVTLPSPATHAGRVVHFWDKNGAMNATNKVTLVRAGSEKIQGLTASYDLTASWGRWTLLCDGTDWYIRS